MPGRWIYCFFKPQFTRCYYGRHQTICCNSSFFLKKVFQEDVAKKSDGDTLEDSDEWALSEDSNGLDSDDEERNDSSFESDEHDGEVADYNVTRFKIQSNSNLRVAERRKKEEEKEIPYKRACGGHRVRRG